MWPPVPLEVTYDRPVSQLKMCREALWSPWGKQCALAPNEVKPENELSVMWKEKKSSFEKREKKEKWH